VFVTPNRSVILSGGGVNNVFVVDSQETPGNFVNTKMGVKNMKRTFAISFFVIAVIALMIGPATAGKPQNVIEKSNGFPSGMHFNLNIHGKNWETCNVAPDDVWGNSIFIPETGTATIQYVSNKKSSVYELTVLDACAGFGFDGENDVAKIQLPYKVKVNDVPTEAGGFYVFGRILGKPDNGGTDTASSIILYPNVVVEACNDPGGIGFGNDTSCDELALGLIVGNNLYTAEPEQYVRFDPTATQGKGKSKATDITRLFTYVGWVVDERLDTMTNNEGACSVGSDGVIDECDVPAEYDLEANGGNNTNVIDPDELENWLNDQAELPTPMAWYFDVGDNMWILNIADLVVTEQGLENDGTKLLQIRFYPVATTEFQPQ
jgi:hypothetical protein